MKLFDEILAARGITKEQRADYLLPPYEKYSHDPFLLPDMDRAVKRLVRAHAKKEKITIYGDYDIDGLTATALLYDGFTMFGFDDVTTFMPNRFVEGYGLTVEAIESIARDGTTLLVTVDCGSLSEKEIRRARELGMDVIVTDHHNVALTQPPAVAVVNPKRLLQDYPDDYENYVLKSNKKIYPFLDLPGVGVAFKLVQALQTKLQGLPIGQEKWLLDLVALGTVCDVVSLTDENRMHVYWGLRVLAKTRRPGLKALMAVAGVELEKINARSLGFALGPRMNASGRLETAQCALDLLMADDGLIALEIAEQLDVLNTKRRKDQDEIYKQALVQAEEYKDDAVLIVSHPDWNHGIIGIVAAKLLETYKKPTYVLQEMGDESKGSARSYGDFSAADAIRAADDLITKGGGHKLAAGVTLPTAHIKAFRQRLNEFYRSQKLSHQANLLLPRADVSVEDFSQINEALIAGISRMEPCGNGNPEPIVKIERAVVQSMRRMGSDSQHIKLGLCDKTGKKVHCIAFNAPEYFFCEPGETITAWFQPILNEWRGSVSVEGRLLHLEIL